MSLIRPLVLTAFLGQPLAAMELIDPDTFLDQATGKTLTFRLEPTGELVGLEQFLKRTLSVWTRADGTCSYGVIRIDGPRLCFTYDDQPNVDHCWFTFESEGALLVGMPESMEVQRITEISDEPLQCRDAPLS